MTCLDFEQAWQSRLDGEPSDLGSEALAGHAVSCASCRERDERYQLLAEALQAMPPLPQPTADLTDRILKNFENEQRPTVVLRSRWLDRVIVGWAAAAAVLIAALGLWLQQSPKPMAEIQPLPGPIAISKAPPARSSALSDATIATFERALTNSIPAARLGRILLETASAVETRSEDAGVNSDEPTGRLLRIVSDHMATGIRPFSGQALRAFDFLWSPSNNDGSTSPTNEPGHGA